jgi:hypothetical protein
MVAYFPFFVKGNGDKGRKNEKFPRLSFMQIYLYRVWTSYRSCGKMVLLLLRQVNNRIPFEKRELAGVISAMFCGCPVRGEQNGCEKIINAGII